MKMEHAVHATTAGTVTAVKVTEGDQVETGRILVVVQGDSNVDGDGAEAGDAGNPGDPGRPS
jgi:propionyl-CoA carboxylase alpha chain